MYLEKVSDWYCLWSGELCFEFEPLAPMRKAFFLKEIAFKCTKMENSSEYSLVAIFSGRKSQ